MVCFKAFPDQKISTFKFEDIPGLCKVCIKQTIYVSRKLTAIKIHCTFIAIHILIAIKIF